MESGRAIELRIVGEGPQARLLRQQVQALGLEDVVSFLGFKHTSEVSSLLSSSHALAVSSDYETFGIPLIEAMAAGKPVISTACGGPEHIITRESGVLVPVGDDDLFAEAICKMIDEYRSYDPGRIRQLAVERFGMDRIMTELIEENYRPPSNAR